MRRPSIRVETGFPIAVVAMLVLVVVAPVVMATPAENGDESSYLDDVRDYEPPSVPSAPTARIGSREYASARAAVDAADPGETVVLNGRFDERLTVRTPDVTLTTTDGAVIDGGGESHVLRIVASNVTVHGLWIRNSGHETDGEDSGVFIEEAAMGTSITDIYLSDILFGVWVDGANAVTITDSRIEGRPDIERRIDRGNGIHLWETNDTVIRGNEITGVRDGIYYSWADDVVTRNNTLWDNRYGVHYMYSDDNLLENNLAVDNDVGYALMVSDRLTVRNNTAVRNTGSSGHGILLKDIEYSMVERNVLVENTHGLYVYNTQYSSVVGNLLLGNTVGLHSTADTHLDRVVNNSFVHNEQALRTTTTDVKAWNDTHRGNYWSTARTVDLDSDGTSEARYRPAGVVEHLVQEHPQAAVFADSPAFDVVRLAESSFPVLESPGVVDRHPLTDPPHDWRKYADTR